MEMFRGEKDHDIGNLASDGSQNKCGKIVTTGEFGEKFRVVR